MSNPVRLGVYFSHSWRPRDVELNLLAWGELNPLCELLVDAPEEAGPNPPYYINRIEELLRRSDLFFCVLTHRAAPDRQGSGGDASIASSVFATFEIRLAERLGIPRFILYERNTGFRSPPASRSCDVYVPFERGSSEPKPEPRQWRSSIAPKIHQWLEWASAQLQPRRYEQSNLVVSLYPVELPDSAIVGEKLVAAVCRAGYERVALRAAFRSNTNLFQVLHTAGLVVAELGCPDPLAMQLYAATHALGIPAIRMIRGNQDEDDGTGDLPWLLRGHPGGYQHDLIRWREPEELPGQIENHARAMFRISRALRDEDTASYFHSKRFSQCYVFLSHAFEPPNRQLIEHVHELLGLQHVKAFEYDMDNRAGEDWRKALDRQLQKTTHFVMLLTDTYVGSEMCSYEFETIMERGESVTILPFMAAGRSVPHPKLGNLHHFRLSDSDPETNAEVVAEQVMQTLRGTKT